MNSDVERRLIWLQEIVAQGPAPLFATVSGAHLYGFESPDSDYDLRGAFVTPLEEVLRLREPEDTISILEERDGLELDWVAHDLSKFARLMTRRNGYVLEQLFSPLVVHGGPWHDELRSIGDGCVIRHLYHHYSGFASNQRKLLVGGDETVKRLLYCYRVLLTGIHVLKTGSVEANLTILNDEVRDPQIADLIERKRVGEEKGALLKDEVSNHLPKLDTLQIQLEEAFKHSTLPEEVTTFAALDDYVVRARMELGRE